MTIRAAVASARTRAASVAGLAVGRVVGSIFRLDERLVNRVDPPRRGPVPVAEIPWARHLEEHWLDLRSELDDLLAAGVEFPDTERLAAADLGTDGRWTSYILVWFGRRLDRNADRCPRTTELLEAVPGVQIAGYTVLHPHSSVPVHQGPSKSLRYHLALRVPPPMDSCRLQIDDRIVVWEDGASAAFDDRSHHAVWNDSDEPRYVLFVQVGWPITGIVGRVHALVGRVFGLVAAGMPARARAYDLELNRPDAATSDRTAPDRSVGRPSSSAEQTNRATFRDPELDARLDRYGFVVAARLDPSLLGALRSLHHRIGHAPDDPQLALNWSFHSRSDEHKRTVHRETIALLGPELDRLFVDHVPFLATFITKWPGESSAFAPHQDPTLVDERRFRGVNIWIPLEDTVCTGGRDNGMLHVVPGSHRFSSAPRVQDVDNFEFAEFEDAILRTHGRAVPTRAGDVLVFDNRLIHYSWPNETDAARVVLSFTVRPAETTPVLLRHDGRGMIDLFRIQDDFYLDVLPAQQHLWQSPTGPATKLAPGRSPIDAARFEQLCRSVGSAPDALEPAGSTGRRWTDPDAFCHLCGATTGLAADDRTGRNNAQLVCVPCRRQLDASGQTA